MQLVFTIGLSLICIVFIVLVCLSTILVPLGIIIELFFQIIEKHKMKEEENI